MMRCLQLGSCPYVHQVGSLGDSDPYSSSDDTLVNYFRIGGYLAWWELDLENILFSYLFNFLWSKHESRRTLFDIKLRPPEHGSYGRSKRIRLFDFFFFLFWRLFRNLEIRKMRSKWEETTCVNTVQHVVLIRLLHFRYTVANLVN